MPFTLKQLSYFQILAEELHFGRAADLAHVTQPALSMQIREFEAQTSILLDELDGGRQRQKAIGSRGWRASCPRPGRS